MLSWARGVAGATCYWFVEIYIAVAYFDVEAAAWVNAYPSLVE